MSIGVFEKSECIPGTFEGHARAQRRPESPQSAPLWRTLTLAQAESEAEEELHRERGRRRQAPRHTAPTEARDVFVPAPKEIATRSLADR